jgi:hypothetical protein
MSKPVEQQMFEWNNGITSFGKNSNQSTSMSVSTHFIARGTKSGTVNKIHVHLKRFTSMTD